MDPKGKTNLFVLLFILVITPIITYGYFNYQNSQKTAVLTSSNKIDKDSIQKQNTYPKILDLGITFKEFETKYRRKVDENESPLLHFNEYTFIDDNQRVYGRILGAKLFISINNRTKKIERIEVWAELFGNKSDSESTIILLTQASVWSLAASIFDPSMENDVYRENMLKRLYDGVKKRLYDKIVVDDLRYESSIYDKNTIVLSIVAKDL